jgi:hypothetical protein
MSIIEVERDEVEDILAELDGYDCTSNLNPGSSRDGFIPAKGSSALQFALKQVFESKILFAACIFLTLNHRFETALRS